MTTITLHSTVWIRSAEQVNLAKEWHTKANEFFFIAK